MQIWLRYPARPQTNVRTRPIGDVSSYKERAATRAKDSMRQTNGYRNYFLQNHCFSKRHARKQQET